MTQIVGAPGAQAVTQAYEPEHRITRRLLSYGVLAGPIYVVAGLIEGLTRPGFDLTRHNLSLLSNGDFGWIHIALFLGTGAMTVAGSIGQARALGRQGSGWGPWLVGIYGMSLIAAGGMTADPMDGFPAGTPVGPPISFTWHGLGHLLAAMIGFLCLAAACMVIARFFRRASQHGWSAYSAASGALFLVLFVAALGLAGTTLAVLMLWAAVVIGWTWMSLVSAHLYRSTATPPME